MLIMLVAALSSDSLIDAMAAKNAYRKCLATLAVEELYKGTTPDSFDQRLRTFCQDSRKEYVTSETARLGEDADRQDIMDEADDMHAHAVEQYREEFEKR